MSVETTRTGLHVVKCDDNPMCGERFTSSSQKGFLRAQLESLGWEVKTDRSSLGGLRTICRWHKNSRTTGPTAIRMPDKRGG